LLIPSPFENYPPEWATFDHFAADANPRYFDLFSSTGDINRFAARYRIARCYQGMALNSVTEPTASGYSALCRVLLVWSAFEFFLKAIGKAQNDLAPILDRYETESWIAQVRAADENNTIYRFIYERVNGSHQRELDNFFDADPCNITYLASAIRHLFAHGALTPNAGGADPNAMITICNILYESLMTVMDTEFSERMIQFERLVNTS
jgi:hypothetical protein